MKLAVFSVLFSVLVTVITGCASNMYPPDKTNTNSLDQLRNQMFGNDNPENHIEGVRSYVFDCYPDLPDDISTLISNTKPKIVDNENKLEYVFFWTLPDKSILEVITTPPPLCEPISCRKSRELLYQ